MENGRNMNAIGAQENIVRKSFEEKEHPRSRSDIMSCRLKNRERQRRYRARKRLEADTKKPSVPNQSPPEHLKQNGNINNHRSFVHCKRNWKKDARNAHTCKTIEAVPSASMISAFSFNSQIQTHCVASLIAAEPPLDRNSHSENSLSFSSGETKAMLGRRDWKAEARRKKS